MAALEFDEAFEAHVVGLVLGTCLCICYTILDLWPGARATREPPYLYQSGFFVSEFICDRSAAAGVAAVGPVIQARRSAHRSGRLILLKACSYSGEKYATRKLGGRKSYRPKRQRNNKTDGCG